MIYDKTDLDEVQISRERGEVLGFVLHDTIFHLALRRRW